MNAAQDIYTNKMIPEISASKVAGFIGLHKYQDANEVMYELLCKNPEIKAKIREIEETNRRRPYNQLVNEILRDSAIQDCVSAGIKAVQNTTDVGSVLAEVNSRALTILDIRKDHLPAALRAELANEVSGKVTKQRGLINENTILDNYEVSRDVKVTERNTKMVRKDFGKFKLIGRTDGFVASENRIVDSKDRTRMWPSVPIYDEIQLRVYMIMTGATESELIERFPDRTTRTTKFMNDPEKWQSLQTALERNTDRLNAIIADPEELKRIVFENTVSM